MAFSLKILPQKRYLLAELAGSLVGHDDLLAYVRNSLAAATEYATRHLLLDERKAQIHIEYVDIISLLDAMDNPDRPRRGYRIAALHHPDAIEIHAQFETAAINRSIVYRAFTDKNEALSWLLPGGAKQ